MSNLLTKLESLTDEELKKVENLINRLGTKDEDDSPPPEKKRRQRRGGGGRRRDEVEPEPQDDEDDVEEQPRRRKPRGRREDFDISEHRRGRRGGRGSERPGTKLARVEPMDTSGRRPNFFKERGFDKLHKADAKIDRLLRGHNRRIEREGSRLITIKCCECGEKCKVSPNVVNDDGRFRCDECIANR